MTICYVTKFSFRRYNQEDGSDRCWNQQIDFNPENGVN